MKITQTGITRRIDDLGRVVIPKEYRRTLHIEEGDAFEICIVEGDNGQKFVGFRPYGPLNTHRSKILQAIRESVDKTLIVGVVDASGNSFFRCSDTELAAKNYDLFREVERSGKEQELRLDNGNEVFAVPLRIDDDVVAAVIICGRSLKEEDKNLLTKLGKTISKLL